MTVRALIVVAAVAAPAGLAQQPGPTSLSGTVRGLKGEPVEATIVLRHNRTRERIEVTTGPDGTYRVPSLESGTYTGIAVALGYEPLIHFEVCVLEGRRADFSVALGPARFDHPTLEALERMTPPRRYAASGPPSHRPAGVMSEADVRAAIAFGAGSPSIEPYDLRDGRRVIGKVFTPFWRVAAMARRAAIVNQPFAPSEIPRAFIEDLVWVVAHRETVRDRFFAPVSAIEVRGRAKGEPIAAAWTLEVFNECDRQTLEALFGPHFTTMAMIAAYEPSAFQPGHEIAIVHAAMALPEVGLGFDRRETRRRVSLTDTLLAAWK